MAVLSGGWPLLFLRPALGRCEQAGRDSFVRQDQALRAGLQSAKARHCPKVADKARKVAKFLAKGAHFLWIGDRFFIAPQRVSKQNGYICQNARQPAPAGCILLPAVHTDIAPPAGRLRRYGVNALVHHLTLFKFSTDEILLPPNPPAGSGRPALACLLPLPYGFFQLVRFVAAGGFALLAVQHFDRSSNNRAWTFVALALLFQPFLKVALGRPLWNVVDVAVAAWLLYLWRKER